MTMHGSDAYAGQTPLTVKLPRNANNRIRIELEGYEPYEIVTTKGFNPATLGNILIGGATGMLIDLATGGIYMNDQPGICQCQSQKNKGRQHHRDAGD